MRAPRILVALLALVCVSIPVDVAAEARTRPSAVRVQARDDYYLPSILTVRRGGTVVWDFTAADRSHTVTDGSGMGLFDSGIVSPGGPSFEVDFRAAGSYPYTCTLHLDVMNGHVDVPVRVWPETGKLGRTFSVRWASARAPDGYVYDVQFKGPGGRWSRWQTGETFAREAFEPARDGEFRFRARLRSASGSASEWSRGASLSVT